MEAEDLGKRPEKGNKHHKRQGKSLPRLGIKISGQEMEGREILVLGSGLSNHKAARP